MPNVFADGLQGSPRDREGGYSKDTSFRSPGGFREIFPRGKLPELPASLNSGKINMVFAINRLTGFCGKPMGSGISSKRPLRVVVSNASASSSNLGSLGSCPC